MSLISTLPARIATSLLVVGAPLSLRGLPPASPAPAVAIQPSPIAGQWTIEWELGRRVENGDVQLIRATGVMTVKPAGDSLVATIDMKSRSDGRPVTPPLTIGGKATAAGAVLSQIQQLRFNVNGDERGVDVKVTWTLTANGDALSGEIVRDMPAEMVPVGPMPPATITGTRVKS